MVEVLGTSKKRCNLLARFFEYRKKLSACNPAWCLQAVGEFFDEDDRLHVSTLFVMSTDPNAPSVTKLRQKLPDMFVARAVASRFHVSGLVHMCDSPELFFRASNAIQQTGWRLVPIVSAQEEGQTRQRLEEIKNDLKNERVPRDRPLRGPAKADASEELPEPEVMDGDRPPLIAFDLDLKLPLRLKPAPREREWIEKTDERFPSRCLPMMIANQAGWELVLDEEVKAVWNGGSGREDIKVSGSPRVLRCASSHFGVGVLTFGMPYLFRTPPGFNLHVRGPINRPKVGAMALEGIVETDWTCASFTMNWMLLEPNKEVVFRAGEPIALFAPVRRGELERFRPTIVSMAPRPASTKQSSSWTRSRWCLRGRSSVSARWRHGRRFHRWSR